MLTLVLLVACKSKKKDDGAVLVTLLNRQTSSVLTLSTAVVGSLPAGTSINSYAATLTLPSGVTVKSMTHPPETDAGAVTASGQASGALVSGTYAPATGSVPATVKIFIASDAGFAPGEFCTVSIQSSISRPAGPGAATVVLDAATGFDTTSRSTVSALEKQLSLSATEAGN